tara:strand:- start:16 stop:1245 length:1230 start_codon:yes stop_codon:yes gene_type:complete
MSDRITKKPRVARQYELSQAQIEDNSIDQGGLPDMPAEGLSPDNRPHVNRAREVSKKDSKSSADFYMGLEAIDEAIFYYFENVIKPSVISNGDMVDVPVIYGSGERWKLAQKDGFYRDKGGKVQTPLVMLKRETIEKRRDLGNKLDANNPQLYVTYQENFTQRNKYDNFALLNNRIPQKEFTATVVPDYVNLTYSGIIWTDYISQLNKIIEAVNYASDAYWGDSERFKFMAQIDQFSNINEVTNDDSRIVRANFTLKLQGYIIPENIQKKLKESNTRWFSKSQIILDSQTTILEDTSTRAKQLGNTRAISSGGGTSAPESGGGTADNDWIIFDSYIENGEGRDVKVTNGFFSVDIGASKVNDIILISKQGSTKLKVDNEGLLSLGTFSVFPPAINGGVLFKDSDFYVGL